MGLITHTDSPYIRALGFMYIRYALVQSSVDVKAVEEPVCILLMTWCSDTSTDYYCSLFKNK